MNNIHDVTEEILNKLKIEDVIGEYIKLRNTGKRFMGVCPFHGDKDPSLSVSPEKGLWHCFGCGLGGNIFSFIMKIESLTFYESLQFLAEKSGIEIELTQEQSQERNLKQRLTALLKTAAFFFYENLFQSSGKQALAYLKDRKIHENTIKRFGLGYAPAGKLNLVYYLRKKGFDDEEILRAGVAAQREETSEISDTFRHRITIPILDGQNRFIAFGARALESGVPKYINSPETAIFTKGKNIFGIHVAKQHIAKADRAVLVEGYFDQMMLWQEGIKTAVASLGTSLTIDQAKLLGKFCAQCTIVFDNDTAGKSAALRSIDILEQAGISTRIATLPEGYDPDRFLMENSSAAFEKYLDDALEPLDYNIASLKEKIDLKTPAGKSEFVRTVVPFINKVKDPVIRHEYLKKTAETANISEDIVRQMLPRENRRVQSSPLPLPPNISLEERILKLCLHYPYLILTAKEELSLSEISDPLIGKIYEILFDLDPNKQITVNDFTDYTSEEGIFTKVTELIMSENSYMGPETSVEAIAGELFKKLRDDKLMLRFQSLKKEVEKALSKNTMDHQDERFIEYQRLYQYFKGRK